MNNAFRPIPLRLLSLALILALLFAGCGGNGGESETDPPADESSGAESAAAHDADKAKIDDEMPPVTSTAVDHGDYLWRIETGESTVYLMGTMHVLRDDYALNAQVLELFYASDALAVESNINDPDLVAGSTEYLFYRDGSTIYDHLSEEGAEHLRAISAEYGYEPEIFEMVNFNAFSVSSLFTVTAAQVGGFSTEGVDSQLLAMAEEVEMPILELEYYADLYIKMESLDDDTMERVCVLPLTGLDEAIEELEELYAHYLTGDHERMVEYLYTEVETDIEYQEKDNLYNYYMITERNEIMAASIAGYLENGGTTFVAAGLAHFLGEGSIVELLTEMGYTVEVIS